MFECPVCKNNRFFGISQRFITCQNCGRTFVRLTIPSSDIRFTDIQEFMDKIVSIPVPTPKIMICHN
jgi:ribosomal protein S27E